MSGCCSSVHFKPTDNAYPWLFSLWVVALPYCISGLLITLTLQSVSGLQWLSMFQVVWQSLSLAAQSVHDCCALMPFKPAYNTCFWLFSLWVAALPLFFKSTHNACPLSSALQPVSDCHALSYFKPVNNAWLWLFSWWAIGIPCSVSFQLTMHVLDSPGGQWLLFSGMFQPFW